MEINPNEEQVTEPSSGEEKETSKEEQVTKPSDSRDRYEKFTEKQAAEKAAKSKETSKEKEAPLEKETGEKKVEDSKPCLLYTSPSPRDATLSRMPSSA